MGLGGVFLKVVPEERIVAAERWDQAWAGGGDDVVTTTFTEESGNTTVTTTICYASKENRDGALAPGMAQGMAAGYDRLDAVLAANT